MKYTKQRSKAKRGRLNPTATHMAVLKSAAAFYEALDTPFSLGCEILLRYSEFSQLAERSVDPLHYQTARSFQKDYAAASYLRKYPSLLKDQPRKARALEKFSESEQLCKATNNRFLAFKRGNLLPTDCRVDRVLSRARSKIAWLLGSLDLNEVHEMMAWGPGTTSNLSRGDTSSYKKFDVAPDCTEMCSHHAWAAITACPSWRQHLCPGWIPGSEVPGDLPLRKIEGNRVTTVPKDALIDRVIAVEPHMNMWVQLGFGKAIRKRLKRVGIDLNDQNNNVQLARYGSLFGTLATVDLSSASDTISYELVRYLLPETWFFHMASIRSGKYQVQEAWQTYHKFSSMGNGYTFELESLIFWALGLSCLSECQLETDLFLVYGDDIIIDTRAIQLLNSTLAFCGFTVNKRKTFSTSPFRESCGGHFFWGVDVKPVYVDKPIVTVIELMALHNQMTLLALRLSTFSGCYAEELLPCLLVLRNCVSPRDQMFGPVNGGDSTFFGTFEESSRHCLRVPHGHEGFSFLGFHSVPLTLSAVSSALLPWQLYLLERRPGSWPIAVQGGRLCVEDRVPSERSEEYTIRATSSSLRVQRTRVIRPEYVGVWL